MSLANNTSHMLFILIPIVWLIVVTLFVAVGRSAACGDAPRAKPERESTLGTAIDGLILWEDPLEVALQDTRPRKSRRLAKHIPHGVR
jgi:hypothetical protein